MDFVMKICFS